MEEKIVYLNGSFVAANQAKVSVLDYGFNARLRKWVRTLFTFALDDRVNALSLRAQVSWRC